MDAATIIWAQDLAAALAQATRARRCILADFSKPR